MDHIKGSRHVCRAYSVPQSTQRLIGSCGEILLIRKLCSSVLNKFEMCCPAFDRVPVIRCPLGVCPNISMSWSPDHCLTLQYTTHFALFEMCKIMWSRWLNKLCRNSFMFVSLVASNREDWSARKSRHGLGAGYTSHVRPHLLAGIDDDDDQIQMQNACWVLKTPALHQAFPPLAATWETSCNLFHVLEIPGGKLIFTFWSRWNHHPALK